MNHVLNDKKKKILHCIDPILSVLPTIKEEGILGQFILRTVRNNKISCRNCISEKFKATTLKL